MKRKNLTASERARGLKLFQAYDAVRTVVALEFELYETADSREAAERHLVRAEALRDYCDQAELEFRKLVGWPLQ